MGEELSDSDEGDFTYTKMSEMGVKKYHFEELTTNPKTGQTDVTVTSFPRVLPSEITQSLMRLEGGGDGTTTADRAEKRRARRKARLERKQNEKTKVMEGIKRLRGLKLKDIRRKLDKLEKVAAVKGLDEILTLEDIDRDYDPDKFDQMISKMFDDKYYANDKDLKKPVFEDTDDELEDMKSNVATNPCAASSSQSVENESIIEEIKDLKKNLDDYSNLQCEGVVAGLPTRFKYRKVTPNTFGLTLDEIMGANEKELNKWVSLKKMFQYRSEQEEKYDLHAYHVKGKQFYKKRNILTSFYENPPGLEGPESQNADNANKDDAQTTKINEDDNNRVSLQSIPPYNEDKDVHSKHKNLSSKSFSNKKERNTKPNSKTKGKNTLPSDDRLLLYGINPKKLKKSLKYNKDSPKTKS